MSVSGESDFMFLLVYVTYLLEQFSTCEIDNIWYKLVFIELKCLELMFTATEYYCCCF